MERAVRDMLLQNQLRINRKKFAERWIYRKSTVFFVWFYLLLVRFYADLFSWSGILVSIPALLTFNFTNLQYLHALCDFALKKRNAGGWFDYVTDSLMPCFYQNYSVKICWFSSSDCRYSDKDEHKLYFERSKRESQRREEVRAR